MLFKCIIFICLSATLATKRLALNLSALWNLNEMAICKLSYSALDYNKYGCW